MHRSTCVVHRLGLVDYAEAWALQDRLAGEIAAGTRPPTLLLLEHPHTFTFGRRGQLENLLWDEAELEQRGVSVHWVDRGGDVTYHGPGQLVGYPLLPLADKINRVVRADNASHIPQADYVGYVRRLEQALILALGRFEVPARTLEGLTGVWVPMQGETGVAKLAAIGVKVDAKGVSRHGFALNVNPDMSYWQGIIGCGLVGHQVTCLADILDSPPSLVEVMDALVASFGVVYPYRLVEKDLV